jgi:hypothetical protein
MKRPEQAIQRAVFEHLAWRGAPGILAWHTPTGGYRSKVEARIFSGLGVIPGLPDVFVLQNGCLHGLELKAPGGRISEVQAECHARLQVAGCRVAVASGLDAALEQLESWGLLRGTSKSEYVLTFEKSPAARLSTAVMTGIAQ